jgi:hypothetical protein
MPSPRSNRDWAVPVTSTAELLETKCTSRDTIAPVASASVSQAIFSPLRVLRLRRFVMMPLML